MRSFLKSTVVGGIAGAALAGGTLALAGTGVGGVFNLGKTNSVNETSVLTGAKDGSMLQVTNSATGASATALGLNVAAGKPPFKVNSSTRVTGLNADKVDGLDSSAFLGKNAKAADADKLDGIDSSGFVVGTTNAPGPSGGRFMNASGSATVGNQLLLFQFGSPFQVRYVCPDNWNENGYVYVQNVDSTGADWFLDNGLADPQYQHIAAGYGDGGNFASWTGESFTYRLRWDNGRIATIWLDSSHSQNQINPSNSTCNVSVQALVSG